jgi:amicyanin
MPRNLRRLLVAAAVPVLALALAAPVAAADEDVSIVDFDFTPGSVTVTVGDTVTWTNNGEAPHDVTFVAEDVKSEILANGETYDRTFESEGTFDYICSIHPQMTGTVVVEAAAAEPTEAPTEEPTAEPTATDPATEEPATEEPATEEPGATQGPPETATEAGRSVPGSLPAILAGLLFLATGLVLATRQAVSRR